MTDGPEDRGPLDFEPDEESEEERRRRWAHRQDPDLVEEGITGHSRPPERIAVPGPPGASRYTWFVGVVGVLLLAVVTLNSLRSDGPGSRGVDPNARMPVFAAPLVTSPDAKDHDVNVATKPGQKQAGNRPACQVRGPQILNACELWRRPVVLAFFADRGAQCVRQLDVLERIRREFPQVNVAAVAVRGDVDKVRRLVRARGWGFPVGYDRDGALANIYGVAVCPHITFAHPGGRVVDSTLGEADESEIEAQVRGLLRSS